MEIIRLIRSAQSYAKDEIQLQELMEIVDLLVMGGVISYCKVGFRLDSL